MSPKQVFGMTSPADILAKAGRELAQFKAEPSADNAFNFFVTIYHVRDYAKAAGLDLTALDSDRDFELCRLAANSSKHLVLDKRSAPDAAARSFDTHGDVSFAGDEEFAVFADGHRIPVLGLGHRVLANVGAWLGAQSSPPAPAI
jgi:hypothetical protein